jgi:hypothetical protein
MRTGKIGLKQFLFRWKVPDVMSAECECGEGNQTVWHVLLACSLFKDLRVEIWGEGRTGKGGMDLKEVLNTPKLARKAASFIIRTRLLGQFGAITEDDAS